MIVIGRTRSDAGDRWASGSVRVSSWHFQIGDGRKQFLKWLDSLSPSLLVSASLACPRQALCPLHHLSFDNSRPILYVSLGYPLRLCCLRIDLFRGDTLFTMSQSIGEAHIRAVQHPVSARYEQPGLAERMQRAKGVRKGSLCDYLLLKVKAWWETFFVTYIDVHVELID